MVNLLKQLFNLIPVGQRYSPNKKRWLMLLIITLSVILACSMLVNVRTWNTNANFQNIIDEQTTQLIADELLTLNKIMGKSICGFVAERIVHFSRKFDVDPLLVFSIIKWESWGRPHVKNSDTGAMGLMAVLHSKEERQKWADWELCDIDANITNGIKKLREKANPVIPYKNKGLTNLPDMTVVLLRYNGVVKAFYSKGEGFEYVSKVLGEYVVMQEKLGERLGGVTI